jgi:hypothetical protein
VRFDDFVNELERLNISRNHGVYIKTENEIKKQISLSYRKTNKQLMKLHKLSIEVKKMGNEN